MKKLLFSVAMLAVAASCSKNEVTDVAPAAQSAIGFATLNNLTKAANDASQQYQVYASQAGVTTGWYIEDYSVTNDDSKLQNTYYWPADGSAVSFYAYAPYTVDATATIGADATSITISYEVPTTADEDFTIAGALTNQTDNTVAFTFAHQLSKATVEVKLDTDLENAGYELSMETGATVSLSVANDAATYDVMGAAATIYTTGSTGAVTYTKDYTSNSFIFMPQASTDCTIAVTGVTIKAPNEKVILDGANSEVLGKYTIATGDVTSDQFQQNYYYAITLTVDETSIDGDGDTLFGAAMVFSADKTAWTLDTDNAPFDVDLGSDNQPEAAADENGSDAM